MHSAGTSKPALLLPGGLRPATVPIERFRVEIDHDILDLGIEFESVAAQLAANSTLLVATEGRLGRIDGWVVDAHIARFDPPRHGVRSLDVIGPDGGRQSEDGAVGRGHDLVFGFERNHRQDRSENLVLRQPHIGRDLSEHGWLDVVPCAEFLGIDLLATVEQFGAVLDRVLTELQHLALLLFADDGSHLGIPIERVSYANLAHLLHIGGEEIVVDVSCAGRAGCGRCTVARHW